jgi:prepilin peptidase CpaA
MVEWIMITVAGAVLLRAVYTDIKSGKIENRLMLTGLISGTLFAAIRDGPKGIICSIKYVAIMFAALIFLFIIRGLGAGDIKLLCVMAAFFQKEAFAIVVAAFFAGACMGIGRMLLRFIKRETVYVRHETLNFSIAILVGAIIVVGKHVLIE